MRLLAGRIPLAQSSILLTTTTCEFIIFVSNVKCLYFSVYSIATLYSYTLSRKSFLPKPKFRHFSPTNFPRRNILKMEIDIYIYCVSLGKLFVGKNYSSGKIIRREKLFVGENHSSGKIIRRGKSFVGKNYSWGKIIRRGKSFGGKNYSSGKKKLFVGGGGGGGGYFLR